MPKRAELVLFRSDTEFRPILVPPGVQTVIERVRHDSGIIEEKQWVHMQGELSDPIAGQPQVRVFREPLPMVSPVSEQPVFDEAPTVLDLTSRDFDTINAEDKREKGLPLTPYQRALTEDRE